MRLKNILITVDDVNRSKHFYKELFGLDVVLDTGGNVILTEGLVLQDRALWEQTIGQKSITYNNAAVIYFEERDIEGFAEKLRQYDECQRAQIGDVRNQCMVQDQAEGRKVIRFYDPDGNLIEVGTPWR